MVLTQNVMRGILAFIKADVDRPEMEVLTRRAGLAGKQAPREMDSFFQHLIHFGLSCYRDSRGQTIEERWREKGYTGLTNDEHVAVAAYGRSYVSVLEVQEVGSDGQFWVIDVFRPESGRFLVIDRAAASGVYRFTLLLSWYLPLPHFTRISGVSAIHVPRETFDKWRAEVERDYQLARSSNDKLTLREHLASTFLRQFDRITEIGEEWRRSMLSGMDVCRAVARFGFSVTAKEIADVLDGKAELESTQARAGDGFDKPWKQFVWVRRGESKALEKEMDAAFQHSNSDDTVGGLATLRLYPERLVLETFSRQKYEFARQLLDRWFGARLRMEAESIEDIAKILADEKSRNPPGADGSQASPYAAFASGSKTAEARRVSKAPPVPPEAAREALQKFHEDSYRRFSDERVPMLGNLTPREASRKPEMRPKLIELMKLHIQGIEQTNREAGTQLNLDGLLDELDLPELRVRG